LLSRLDQLEVHLQRLNEAQEQLLLTIEYLQQTSAPFLVLSCTNSTERYLDRQRVEITAVKDAILEAIRLLRELQVIDSPAATDSSASILVPTAPTAAAASSSSAINPANSAPGSLVRNLELQPIPTVERAPRTIPLKNPPDSKAKEHATR
jgi:hypothetical protein